MKMGRMRVLVIDDSPVARTALRQHLEHAAVDVFDLASAIGATRAILQNGIDAVVVDVSMPGLSGDKLVDVLRSNSRLRGLVIVLVSAKPSAELREIARTCACDGVLSKDEVDGQLVPLLKRLVLSKADPLRTPRAVNPPAGTTK